MAKNSREDHVAPTMIIPRGTEISVDAHGQLSVRSPGNLVIQHSGQYGNLESVSGSIRIEPEVDVEAVSVKCPDTCYVQGNLTAWKVTARSLQLEDTARAHIVLQETEKLEIGKGARLVGNFTSEKELFFLFSRFSKQVRSLPLYRDRPEGEEGEGPSPGESLPLLEEGRSDEIEPAPAVLVNPEASQVSTDLDDALFFALMLLERSVSKEEYPEDSQRVLGEVIKLLRQGDLETLQHTYRTLFGRVVGGGEMVTRAQELIGRYFSRKS